MGFLGADLIVSPTPHLTVDFQVSTLIASTASGYGVAPMLQVHFNDPGLSSAYLAAGWLHAAVSLGNVNASVSGYASNVGYEWRWHSGTGLLLGAGVSWLGRVHATDGVDTVSLRGGAHFNLELGLRFLFI
jgi:hypothetical protein